MRHENSVFHALLKQVPWAEFDRLVARHGSDRRVRRLRSKDQLVALLFGQPAGASSLREIEAGLASHSARLYHLAGRPPARSTLADANAKRPAALFADLFALLSPRAGKRANNPLTRPLREIVLRLDGGKRLRLPTNDLDAPAPRDIADLYKRRWAIELFFRWVKQNLKIRRFLGTSHNAVKTQIAIALSALSAFVLLRNAQNAHNVKHRARAFARLVQLNLMHRKPIQQLAKPPDKKTQQDNQLNILTPTT